MSEPTEADRAKARELALLARSGVGGAALREGAIAQALADEREKARAPFLKLADIMCRKRFSVRELGRAESDWDQAMHAAGERIKAMAAR